MKKFRKLLVTTMLVLSMGLLATACGGTDADENNKNNSVTDNTENTTKNNTTTNNENTTNNNTNGNGSVTDDVIDGVEDIGNGAADAVEDAGDAVKDAVDGTEGINGAATENNNTNTTKTNP